MATREEIISGLEMLIRESRRIGAQLTDEQWATTVDLDGWQGREVLAHVASVGTIVPQMAGSFTSAAPGTDSGASINIDQLNAALVGARKDKTIAELVDEVATAYAGVIDFVKSAPDDLLTRRVTFAGYKDVEMSEIVVRMVVLHGLAHIYSAYSAVMNNP